MQLNVISCERTDETFTYKYLDNDGVEQSETFDLVDQYNDYSVLSDEEVLLSRCNEGVEVLYCGASIGFGGSVDSRSEDYKSALNEVVKDGGDVDAIADAEAAAGME